ncbi:MAG: hypothetical protein IJH37_06175 [Clostridia bacterium]|nr:hypothetical protein [Clostridia bacterium]
MSDKGYDIVKKFYVLLIVVSALGAVLGALYYVNLNASKDNINNYVTYFANGGSGSVDNMKIMVASLKGSLVVTVIFTLASLIKPGMIAIAAITLRRGFIYGFTNAAMMSVVGVKGIYITLLRLPEMFFMLLGMFALGAAAGGISVSGRGDIRGKIKFFNIFLIISLTTFCAAAVCEGFLTTIFMNTLLKWLT